MITAKALLFCDQYFSVRSPRWHTLKLKKAMEESVEISAKYVAFYPSFALVLNHIQELMNLLRNF